MGSCGHLIHISVIRLLNPGGKIDKGWDNHVNGARDNEMARVVDNAADRKLDAKAQDNEGRKVEGNAVPAVVRAAAERREIPSSWPLIQTVTANCRPVKSQMLPYH